MATNSPEPQNPSVRGAGRPAPRTGDTTAPDTAGRPSATPPGTPPEPGKAPRTVAPSGAGTPGKQTKTSSSGRGTPKKSSSSSGSDWNVFRTVVVLVGVVIAGFGAYYLILGTAGLPETGGTPVNPTLENQFRFFSAMMIGVGAAFITIAIKFQWANMLWLVCLMVFVGGIGRVLSWAFSGTPHYLLIILMVIELAFPPALLVWHKYIAKTSELRREYSQQD